MSMAKIDWSKHRFSGKEFESIDQEKFYREREKRIQKQLKNSGTITFGKYKGTKIKNLKTNYLVWLTTNVKSNLYTKAILDQAHKVLKSRHKVGRPVCNTAEEKV